MKSAKFWMVVGSGVPYHKHPSLSAACKEAERLATSVPGEEFTVLASVASVVKRELSWWEHIDIDVVGDSTGNDVPV